MRVPVLLYHKISYPRKDTRIRGAFTAPKKFYKQMAYLIKAGFVTYTASELIQHFTETGEFPRNGVALTFDDGWKDNYTNAFPILKKLGIKATIFIIPSSIGEMSTGATAEGEQPHEHLSKEEILEMASHGIEFGSHSLRHQLLNQIGDDEVHYEVNEAKREIEELVQKPCWTFAYPAGFFTDTARRAVAEAGHIAAFSTVYGPTDKLDPFALNRIEILRRDRFTFQFARKVEPLRA